jgi:ABC-2 type transport system permease protein
MFSYLKKLSSYEFVFTELVKRDFKAKYKRSFLGVLWSMLAPLFTLLVMYYVFRHFFGQSQPHYVIYLFTGLLVFQYYSEATNGAMQSLVSNAGIFSKVNVPKYLFLFSRVVSSSLNFLLTLVVYFAFVLSDSLAVTWRFILLLYPLGCLFLLVCGAGLILSALYVFFRDVQYLYGVFTTALMYFTPIFYQADILGEDARIFLINPLYLIINYMREIVIYARVPSLTYHGGLLVYVLLLFGIGAFMYKRYNYNFLYYL